MERKKSRSKLVKDQQLFDLPPEPPPPPPSPPPPPIQNSSFNNTHLSSIIGEDFFIHRYICSIYVLISVQCSLTMICILLAERFSPEIWQKQSIHLTIVFGLLTLFLFIYISCRPLLDKNNNNNNNNNNNQNDNQQQQQQIFQKIKNSFYWFDAILLIIFTFFQTILLTSISFIHINIFANYGHNIIKPLLILMFCWSTITSLFRCWYHYNQFAMNSFGKFFSLEPNNLSNGIRQTFFIEMIITSILMFSNDYQDNNNDHNIKHIYLAIQLAFNITIFMILYFAYGTRLFLNESYHQQHGGYQVNKILIGLLWIYTYPFRFFYQSLRTKIYEWKK